MTYKIARDGQEFGPYSLADVQRYVGTGNILLTDLALAEGSTEWISVSQVVGTIAVQPVTVPAAYAGAAMPQFPDPPNLNWILVMVFNIVGFGLFTLAWNLVQALWIKKVQPESKAPTWYFIVLGITVLSFIVLGIMFSFAIASHGQMQRPILVSSLVLNLISLASFIVNWCIYPFVMRASLLKHFNEVDPIGLQLSGVMTFFFTNIYFQYHLNRINEIKRAYRLSNPY